MLPVMWTENLESNTINMDDRNEDQILAEYAIKLAHYDLQPEQILKVRQAVKRIARQILDHYFAHLNDS
jgi:hypothetical protein